MAMELKILITWSNGFIWKYLTKELDILWIPYIWFKWDLLNKNDIVNIFENNNIDLIVHLVWTFDEPFENQIELNFNTTKNLLEVWKRYWVKKIIYSSTWAVYWEPIWDESFEEDFCKPNTFYWLSKKITEDLLFYYTNNYWIESVILRFPNVYWEWNYKWVIYNFKNSIEKNWELILYWDWEQSRNFLYILDAIDAIIKSINYDWSDIFNISNPIKISLNDLVKIFQDKYEFKILYKDSNNNLKDLLLNIDKAKNKLWFSPNFTDIII